ncbi:MAG: ABC-2 type transport system ATP-binding [Planctomycetota bacterium]|nr:MAG: ABC-2 type transport system ATP-binding [Planctomycetota bacterium]
MISFERASRRFGPKVAVHPLDLSIGRGEFFAFLGPNGAGKTTTLKMAAGLLRPSEGRVLIGGIDIGIDPIAAKRLLAYVPDQPYLYDKLTGREFLRFVAGLYGIDTADARADIDRYVATFDMKDWIDELTETYSHGMKQRVALAATLLHEPRVVLLDEPLVGLDPQTSRLVKGILREHASKGTTIFMSTHVLSVAEQTADRIGILNQGKLVALGTMDELRAKAGKPENLEDIFFRIVEEAEATGK